IRLNSQLFTHQYRYTTLFFLLLTTGFLLNFSISYDLITKRYLPFVLFLLFLLFFNRNDFNVYGLIRFLRATFFACLLVYFTSSYLPLTRILIESDSIFSVASGPNSYSLVYFSFVRNMGFFWDHRILAIYSYLYLLLTVVYKPKYFRLDILLSLIIVITSTSRGGMVTYALIMFVYLFQIYRARLFVVLGIAISCVVFAIIIAGAFLPSSTLYFLNSFNPNSEYNAMSQRHFFSDYAMDAFKEHPLLGQGVGSLSSHLIDRHLVVDGVEVPAVTDAYWYVLLAEMGIVGFVFYLLFLMEVFFSNKLLSIALLIGFSIQLLGTDIPDMRFYYFAILVTVYIINLKFKKISLNELKYA
ncbi:MAG: O-antigen ligase family protein, partial [Bacteroidia bacterium]|nr:O-antigen ligase family protein [Bacteroidia bacterium]